MTTNSSGISVFCIIRFLEFFRSRIICNRQRENGGYYAKEVFCRYHHHYFVIEKSVS